MTVPATAGSAIFAISAFSSSGVVASASNNTREAGGRCVLIERIRGGNLLRGCRMD